MWNPFKIFSNKPLLNDADKQRLVRAIHLAEQQTSGEIRVYVESKTPNGDAMARCVEKFEKHKMFNTAARNGVLIYLAVKEKKVAIFGDQGIHEKVGDAFWNQTVQDAIEHFKTNKYIDGLEAAVASIGSALQSHFPFDRTNDTNELSDEIMVGK